MSETPPPRRSDPPGPEDLTASVDALAGGAAANGVDARLLAIIEDCEARLRRGEVLPREEIIARHPDLAVEIASCLSGLEFIHRTSAALGGGGGGAAVSAGAPARQGAIGGFRIIREIGSGGMGVVYEAEQVSLKRRVALKVLRYGPMGDPELERRFRREAETAARLHHTNLVPIHEVGVDRGVHYYAMQLIEGESLADRIRRFRDREPDAERWREIARIGFQAADALAYAHERGVIHRDIKPANLLIDREGTLWVTDFGLAKHTSEAALTLSGRIVGTPRYMSPEQARAGRGAPVDRRTDIYSLGVTLYECLTGVPAVEGDTPQAVIHRICEEEPIAPRRREPRIPRDLETIVLRAIAKRLEDRYAAAALLASDLRCFHDGVPILARRLSLAARLARWARRHRRSIVASAVSTGSTAFLVLAALLAVSIYRRATSGLVDFGVAGEPWTVTVVDASGRTAVDAFTAPTPAPLRIAAGPLELRLGRDGAFDERCLVDVERGATIQARLPEGDLHPWGSPRVSRSFALLDIGGRSEILCLLDNGVTRAGVVSGESWWAALDDAPGGVDAAAPASSWIAAEEFSPHGGRYFSHTPRLLEAAPDLDGDVVPDAVFALRHRAGLVALSAASGRPLFAHDAVAALRARLGPAPGRPRDDASSGAIGGAIGHAVARDVDDDGVADLVQAWAAEGAAVGRREASGVRWIEAVSGSGGATLWAHVLDDAGFDLALGASPPAEARLWSPRGIGVRYESRPGIRGVAGSATVVERDGPAVFASYPAVFARDESGGSIVCAAGRLLVTLDPRTGAPRRAAVDLGACPVRPPQVVDLDGDGRDEIIVLRPAAPAAAAAGAGAAADLELAAWDVAGAAATPRWTAAVAAVWGLIGRPDDAPGDWPLVVDLDRDGAAEIIVPHVAGGACALRIVDSRSGSERRSIALGGGVDGRGIALPPDRFIAIDDVDGGGARDLVAALSEMTPRRDERAVVLEARSSETGAVLWRAGRERSDESRAGDAPWIAALERWRAGDRDGDRIALSYRFEQNDAGAALVVSGKDGRVLHEAASFPPPRVADLDGDGLDDLCSFLPDDAGEPHRGGRLLLARGGPALAWQRLDAAPWIRAGDLDGDGVEDIAGDDAAWSGRDGAVLWRRDASEPQARRGGLAPAGDLDGDGAEDLLQAARFVDGAVVPPFVARSGRDGRELWSCDLAVANAARARLVARGDLDGDGAAELVVFFAGAVIEPGAIAGSGGLSLAALSSATGRTLWRSSILDDNPFGVGESTNESLAAAIADVDGDGAADVVFAAPTSARAAELRALSGRDGAAIWIAPLTAAFAADYERSPPRGSRSPNLLEGLPVPVAADLDGDGRAEVLVLDAVADGATDLVALDGAAGSERWRVRIAGAGHDLPDASEHRAANRPVPLVFRPERGGPRAVVVWSHRARSIALVGARGDVIDRLDLAPYRALEDSEHPDLSEAYRREEQSDFGRLRVLSRDLDGDGADELIFNGEGRILATRGGLRQVYWERRVENPLAWIESIEDDARGRPALIWIRLGWGGRRHVALDAASGRPRWRSHIENDAEATLLRLRGARRGPEPAPPRFVIAFDDGARAACRAAVWVDGD